MTGFVVSVLTSILVVGCARQPSGTTLLPPPQPLTLFAETFEQLDPRRWREIQLRGQTRYTIEQLPDGSTSLKAHSHAAASILVCPLRFDPSVYPWLSWRWRVDKLVEGEDLVNNKHSDASARIYVYFDTPGLPWQKRALIYVWSAHLPVGTIVTSPFPGHPKILIVESGSESLGAWREERRNIWDDYAQCYGGYPPTVVAIALMSDTDSGGSEAVAYYDDVMVSREEPRRQSTALLPSR